MTTAVKPSRAARGDRIRLGILGLVLLLAGGAAALLGFGVFGRGRAGRPLLDPLIVEGLRDQPTLWRGLAIGAGVVLLVLGLLWTVRSLSPEHRPDLLLDATPEARLLVTGGAAADAVADRAAGLRGIARARGRMVGTEASPALRLTVWITDDADVGALCRRLEEEIVAEARTAFGLPALPVAIRLELDALRRGPRVA